MCGICGFIEPQRSRSDAHLAATVDAMAARIAHRGPDGHGTWTEAATGTALGHRRLAIIDPSAQGHQPMASPSGRWVLTFNGEVYNFEELRRELGARAGAPAIAWRGHSDTEVLLAAIDTFGVRGAVERANGMFAFAAWDRADRTLWLARDRMGEKPLYYGWSGNAFLFGSELKALRAHPAWTGTLDRGALALYMRYGYVPVPHSAYVGIAKLPAGHLLALDPASVAARIVPPSEAFWSVTDAVAAGRADPFRGSEGDAIEALDTLLRDAVAMRMVSDVPLGAFLSGGVDSSTVVAMMQAQSARRVRTFSIGFREPGYDEAPQARAVAEQLGTDHTEWYVSPEEAQRIIPQLPIMYDDPFADASQLPTHLVSSLARRHVTVALSGDGGDELFGGYARYLTARDAWPRVARLPVSVRRAAAMALRGVGERTWDRTLGALGHVLPAMLRRRDAGRFVHRAADVLAAESSVALYRGLVSQETEPATLVGATEPDGWLNTPARWPAALSASEQMMFFDQVMYLTDDILVKLDRASMAVSLEARVPFLDHRVLALAWRLPLEHKLHGHTLKWIVRQVLDRYVPRALVDRPKMGFSVPLDAWLRGPLRSWADDLLSEAAVRAGGILDPARTRARWDAHQSGAANNQYWLWHALMLQSWLSTGNTT